MHAGAGQLATELTISTDEFESYGIFAAPISLAFHLREFNVSLAISQHTLAGARLVRANELAYGIDQATIAYAESMEAVLDVRFTEPASALYVNVQNDSIESLFAMSTSRVPGAPTPPTAVASGQPRTAGSSESVQDRVSHKRPREETAVRHRTPAKVVERIAPPAFTRGSAGTPPPPLHVPAQLEPSLPVHRSREELLFLPGSQMSAADKEALHVSGLGDMDADEFNAMMEDEGEEVGRDLSLSDVPPPPPVPPSPPPLRLGTNSGRAERRHNQGVNFSEDDIEEMGPTQSDESSKVWALTFSLCPHINQQFRSNHLYVLGGQQAFQPLFDD
jgi:cell cycle checkpoint control protein RAD9A